MVYDKVQKYGTHFSKDTGNNNDYYNQSLYLLSPLKS